MNVIEYISLIYKLLRALVGTSYVIGRDAEGVIFTSSFVGR